MMKRYLINIFILVLFSTGLSYGQITIGSNEPPSTGTLLDLKQDGNTQRGLGLPRVELKSLKLNATYDNLSKTINGATGNWDKNEHIGLMVYHVSSGVCIPSGIYVWGGELWQPLRSNGVRKPSKRVSTNETVAMKQPNSYIVAEPSVVEIPIAKAIAAWNGGWKADDGITNVLSPISGIENKTFSAVLLWSDDQCNELIINADNLEIKGTGADRYIEVWVGDKKGNAVIALVDANNATIATGGSIPTGVVGKPKSLWSWHIWSTDEPLTKTFNDLVWMDRNLGASSIEYGNIGSSGLTYQWGRKDPIPGAKDWTGVASYSVYDNKNIEINYTGSTFTANGSDMSSDQERLSYAVNAPLSFMMGANSSTDWYTIASTGAWHNRWGASGTKSPSDPCPEGWRVPNGKGATSYPWNHTISPWNGLNATNFPLVDKGRANDQVGYYPFSGARSVNSGGLIVTGASTYIWSSAPSSQKTSSLIVGGAMVAPVIVDRGFGLPVRCVRE